MCQPEKEIFSQIMPKYQFGIYLGTFHKHSVVFVTKNLKWRVKQTTECELNIAYNHRLSVTMEDVPAQSYISLNQTKYVGWL